MSRKTTILIGCLLVSSTLNVFSSGSQDFQNGPPGQNNTQAENHQGPDLEKIAEELGVTTAELKEALGEPGKGSPEQ